MQTTTLQGIFPEPKPVHRRNFIRENVKSIKQMQGILQDAGVIKKRIPKIDSDKYRNTLFVPHLVKNRDNAVSVTNSEEKVKQRNAPKNDTYPKKNSEESSKFTHRAMQTERSDDLSQIYETGIIKYPRQNAMHQSKKSQASLSILKGQGDIGDETVTENLQNLGLEEKDFIKENKQNIRPKPLKQQHVKVLKEPPSTYQRGVVPKYLRDRKDEVTEDSNDTDCPSGHILLPEEERKETLRVLRQSYADRIQELNMMPVRSDTLKMRRRKMEIEEELKRIDGGIKVFQRPKVFVKINA